MYNLDIDEIRELANSIGSSTSDLDEQFERLNSALYKKFGVILPKGLKRASYEKFMDIVSSPLIYERTVNSILKRKIKEGETNIKLKNPRALYRIGILGFREPIKLNLMVEGNVGNGLADKGYSGKIIVDGFATELAAQNNQATDFSLGVDILVRKGCMERAMGQARGGSLITFGAGYNSGLYMSGGILVNLGHVGQSFGPGMVGGLIYSMNGTTPGEGATIQKINNLDYAIIFQILKKFEKELNIEGLNSFSSKNPILWITNDGKMEKYDFREYNKIVSILDSSSKE